MFGSGCGERQWWEKGGDRWGCGEGGACEDWELESVGATFIAVVGCFE